VKVRATIATAGATTLTALTIAGLTATIALVAVASGATGRNAAAERLVVTGDSAKPSSTIHVRAGGPISGRGTVTIKSSGRVDHTTLHLPKGTVRLNAIEQSFVVHPDPTKCLAVSTGRGTFKIIGGTKAFRGVSGHGTYRRRTTIVGARSAGGACLGNSAPPSAEKTKTTMTGTASLS
jgi:hypothetical protein